MSKDPSLNATTKRIKEVQIKDTLSLNLVSLRPLLKDNVVHIVHKDPEDMDPITIIPTVLLLRVGNVRDTYRDRAIHRPILTIWGGHQ
jgi:hypothetical protein